MIKEVTKVRSPEQIQQLRETRKRYYAKQKEQYKLRYHKYQERMYTTGEGIDRTLLQAARNRSKLKGLAFDITVEDIPIPKTCPVLGIPIQKTKGGKHSDNSPSLDRIDPTKGYEKGNVIVVSYRANTIKSFGTPEEHLKIYKFYSRLK